MTYATPTSAELRFAAPLSTGTFDEDAELALEGLIERAFAITSALVGAETIDPAKLAQLRPLLRDIDAQGRGMIDETNLRTVCEIEEVHFGLKFYVDLINEGACLQDPWS